MQRTTKQFTISLPPDMAEQVVAAAKAESRTISELFREAFRTYRAQRIQTPLKRSLTKGRRRRRLSPAAQDPVAIHSGGRLHLDPPLIPSAGRRIDLTNEQIYGLNDLP